ncbi:MAG TPA: FaeA/PapI family transcriptional regulator [Vicinamibacteria bacterium]
MSKRFAESTRGRLVARLRAQPCTVENLAGALGVTDNAIRAHLISLERDGLIEHQPVRRGSAGKPAHTYALTTEAEMLLSAAYAPVLAGLLDVVAERSDPAERKRLLRAAGRGLPLVRAKGATPRRRLGAAVELINELGGIASLERHDGSAVIHSRGCPLSAVVSEHPEACEALASAIEELVGARTEVRCDRGDGRPRCAFEVALPPA